MYDYCKKSVFFDFSVAPDNSYEHVFHKGHDHVDDDAQHLAPKIGQELPIEPRVLRWWEKSVETLREMVLWLNSVRQHQEVAPSK